MDSSSKRLTEIFFYGLYMDEEILHERGVAPRNKRLGTVADRRLRIGKNCTLMRETGSEANGIVCSLTHYEINELYAGSGLYNYVPEVVLVRTEAQQVPALCYVLLDPPSEDDINKAYFQRLSVCMKQYGMPVPKKV